MYGTGNCGNHGHFIHHRPQDQSGEIFERFSQIDFPFARAVECCRFPFQKRKPSFFSEIQGLEIRFIDEEHAADINIPNEPFPIRGRMVVTYNGSGWEHTERLLPPEQIEEMTFPDENYNYNEMKKLVNSSCRHLINMP